ncbi:LysR family transcriptional regulator [Mangrovibacter plantisponsor]|uniref:DNA-binding transcriptional LysR family regulator n=1 Tax=Mangrovibacter plantisponsor TaxID=451513 RepID=A0A317PNY0_9ENTR|nr:LysR family transcriptional regulator [Mangrovibacter plantisponsor]PWW02702.1 DNA-binding transcriptional LysR family regulator [Mangrovibacter plantisponsor]
MLNNELRYFLAVATTGSLSQASQQLYVASSAISRQIHKLESRMGVTLFQRHARGMVLTDAGQILANHVRKSLRDMDNAVAEIQGLKAVRKALVRLACTDGMAFDLFPGLIARFRRHYPSVSFDLQVGTAQAVAEWVRKGTCDAACQFSLAPERDVDIVTTWPAPVLLLLHPGHPLAQQDKIAISDLQDYPVALPEPGTTIRQLFDLSCRLAGTFLEPALSCNNFATLYGATRQLPGAVTVCSHFSVLWRAKQDGMVLKPIDSPTLSQRTLQLQTPASQNRSAALNLFLEETVATLTQAHHSHFPPASHAPK